MSTHYYIAGGKSLEIINQFLAELTAGRRERFRFAKEHGATGIEWRGPEWGLSFKSAKNGVTQLPDGFYFHRKTKLAVGDKKTAKGREIAKEMNLPKYHEPSGHELARRLKINDIRASGNGFETRTPGVTTIGNVVILCAADWLKIPADCTRISDMEYERMVAESKEATTAKAS